MFSFFSDILEKSGLEISSVLDGFRLINFSNRAVYLEGFLKVVTFENTNISFKMKKGILKINGEDLVIKNLNTNTVLVCGNIGLVESF